MNAPKVFRYGTMNPYTELLSAVREALVAYQSHPGESELESLVAVLQRALEGRHSVKVLTPRRLHEPRLPFKIVEPGKIIRYGPSNHTVRFAASAISHIQVDQTMILAGPHCYFFQETDAEHYSRLYNQTGVMFEVTRTMTAYGITINAVKDARRTLLRRLELEYLGIEPDDDTFRRWFAPSGCPYNLAEATIENLMLILLVKLEGSILKPQPFEETSE